MEIADESNWMKWRDQNIFYGDVTTKKFTEAHIGLKYKTTSKYELYDFRKWCQNPKGSVELVKGFWNSGIKILDNDVNKIDTKTNVATFEFQRPLVTLYSETMDLVVSTEYFIYLSYGVFASPESTDKNAVRGAVKPGYNLTPHPMKFNISPDTKKPVSSNSGANALGLAAIVATGCALTSLI